MKVLANPPEWLIIVNPNAGRGKGSRDWIKIESLLSYYSFHYKVHFTQAKHHATKLAKAGIKKGYRRIVAVGGDGTMNEVVNGCFIQNTCPSNEILLAMITVGTGNDWGRMFGIPKDYKGAIQIIKNGKTHLQDAGMVEYYRGVKKEKRYFINIAGLGFDAVVVKNTNLQKERGRSGKALYMWNLLKGLMTYRSTQTEVIIDGNTIINRVFTISLGIGRYSGGGMMQTPHAVTDDGLFDITIINKIGKGDIILSLKKLYDGSILDHPKINGYKGRHILIDSDPLIHVEADGESLGHSPIEFNIIPRSINVICNSENAL